MSIIDKKPFIVKVLDTLYPAETKRLKELVNGLVTDSQFVSLVPQSSYLLNHNVRGISKVKLELPIASAQNVYEGFLIHVDEYCVLVSYSGMQNQNLTLIDMHYVNGLWQHKIMSCELTIGELRSELNDRLMGGGIVPEPVSGGGTCHSYVVSDKITNIAALKTLINSQGEDVYDKDGKDISQDILDGEYDEIFLINGEFNSNDDTVNLYTDSGTYIYITFTNNQPSSHSPAVTKGILVECKELQQYLNLGDIFLVSETNVPDRWVASVNNRGDIVLYQMESELNNVLGGIISEVYSDAHTYDVGDLVIYDNKLYRCKTAIATPENWTASHWQRTYLSAMLPTFVDTGIYIEEE